MQSFENWPIVVIAPINVAELGTGVCGMKYFTEGEFSGIFSLAGGNFASSKREFPVALVTTRI